MWGYRSNSQKNRILKIITVILAMLLGIFLWMDKVSEDKKSAELRALNKKLFQEEQAKAEAHSHQSHLPASIRNGQMALM